MSIQKVPGSEKCVNGHVAVNTEVTPWQCAVSGCKYSIFADPTPQDYRQRMEQIVNNLTNAKQAAVHAAQAENEFASNAELVEPANALLESYKAQALDALMEVMVEGQIAELKELRQNSGNEPAPLNYIRDRLDELRAKLSAHKPGKDEE